MNAASAGEDAVAEISPWLYLRAPPTDAKLPAVAAYGTRVMKELGEECARWFATGAGRR